MRAEPTTAEHTASIAGSDPQVSERSVTSISISFDALSADPISLQGCVLWNRRAFMVRIMASAKDQRGGGCGHVKMKALSVTRKFLDEHAFVQTHCNTHLSQHTFVQHGANP